MRSAAEQKLINAIIDGEVEAKKLSEKARDFGVDLGKKLTAASKKIVAARASGTISAEQAKKFFKEAFINLTLIGFAEVAQEVADHSKQVAGDIYVAARQMGDGLPKASPIRKADFVAREVEKANGE